MTRPTTTPKISDLMEAGFAMVEGRQAFRYLGIDSDEGATACALGCVFLGAGENYKTILGRETPSDDDTLSDLNDTLFGDLPLVDISDAEHTDRRYSKQAVHEAIMTLNDDYKRPIPKIAQWLRDLGY